MKRHISRRHPTTRDLSKKRFIAISNLIREFIIIIITFSIICGMTSAISLEKHVAFKILKIFGYRIKIYIFYINMVLLPISIKKHSILVIT